MDKAVEIEGAAHGDIEVIAQQDSYDGIVVKVLKLMEKGLSSEREYTHILKTDDDSFVNICRIFFLHFTVFTTTVHNTRCKFGAFCSCLDEFSDEKHKNRESSSQSCGRFSLSKAALERT